MKQIKSLEQCLPVLRGRCIDCFREYSDRATGSCCCPVRDSRASPEGIGGDECPAPASTRYGITLFFEEDYSGTEDGAYEV